MPEKRKRPQQPQAPDMFTVLEPRRAAPAPTPAPLPPAPPLRPSDPRAGSPLVGRTWLLAHPTEPDEQLVPGALAMHIRPSTLMHGRWLYLYVVEAVQADPDAHRMLVWLHAAPVSAFPGLRRVVPASELIPWKWRPGMPSLEQRKHWSPASAALIQESDAQAQTRGLDTLNAWLDVNWLGLGEAARTASTQPDDATAEGLGRLNLPAITQRPAARSLLANWLRQQGVSLEAQRRVWGEAGVPSWELAALTAPNPGL